MGEWRSREARLRTTALTGLLGLTAAAAAACWVWHVRRARKRRRAAGHDSFLGGNVPSLAEEIREALEREAAELQRELPAEDLQKSFAAAAAFVSSQGGEDLSTKVKLSLYGRYKQVSKGDASETAPRSGGMEGAYKWEAWKLLRGTSRAEAMQSYVRMLDEAVPRWRSGIATEAEAEEGSTDGRGQAADGTHGMGPAVSTMGLIGDMEKSEDVDDTPVGQLCEKIANGEAEKARALLQRSPDLAFQADKDGMTPLHWAADRGELEVAKVLIQEVHKKEEEQRKRRGPPPQEKTATGSTSTSSSSLLDARDENGDTPLHFAVNTENIELAKLLVVAGADRSAKNNDGETPADLAEGELFEKVFGGAS